MTFRFNARQLVLFLSLSVFFSCKKDDNPTPTPPPEEPTVFERVQGRWDAEVEPPARSSNPAVSPKNQDMPHISSVEFFSDSSYILVFDHYRVYTGKFTVTDSTAFNFADFGAITNLKLSDDSISFSCMYDEDLPVSVKAAKVDEIVVSADKKPLLKTWVLSEDEDGAELYQEHYVPQGEKITMQFTASGTFLTRFGNDDKQMRNWKWHPQIANAAVQYYPWESENDIEYNSYYKLVELTSTSLKIQQMFDEGEEDVVVATYVLSAQ
ncbi:MAG: hypothetical protein ACTHMM_10805 [Agriterribacter sp.]